MVDLRLHILICLINRQCSLIKRQFCISNRQYCLIKRQCCISNRQFCLINRHFCILIRQFSILKRQFSLFNHLKGCAKSPLRCKKSLIRPFRRQKRHSEASKCIINNPNGLNSHQKGTSKREIIERLSVGTQNSMPNQNQSLRYISLTPTPKSPTRPNTPPLR